MTRSYLARNYNPIYKWLFKNKPKLLNKYFTKTTQTRSFNNLKKEALKYKTRGEWQKKDSATYSCARKRNLLEMCCVHMGKPKSRKKPVTKIETNEIFESLNYTARQINISASFLLKCIKNKTKCGGYHWAYCDEKGNIIK